MANYSKMEVLLEVLANKAHHEVGVQVGWEADRRQAEHKAKRWLDGWRCATCATVAQLGKCPWNREEPPSIPFCLPF